MAKGGRNDDRGLNVIAHNAQGIEPKAKLRFALVDGVEQYLTALHPRQPKLAVVAANSDVVAVARLDLARRSRHEIDP